MNEWQKALSEKHGLFVPPGWYGFAIREGWKPLVDKLCGELKSMGWTGEVHQIKEKFGTLRFYVGGLGPYVADCPKRKLIHEAENASAGICEDCGAEGSLRAKRPWWRTLCDKCNEKER